MFNKHHSFSSDGQNLTEKHSQPYSDCDIIDDYVITLKPLSIGGKIPKIYMKNACITCNKCCITTKFGAKAAPDRPIPHAKENPKFPLTSDIMTSSCQM